MDENEAIEHRWITRSIENAQKKVESHNFDIRKHLLEYDDVMNQQREVIYSMRKGMLLGENLKEFFSDIIKEECEAIEEYLAQYKSVEEWNFEELNKQIYEEFNINIKKDDFIKSDLKISDYLNQKLQKTFEEKIEELPEGIFLDVCRTIFLQSLDTLWKEHLKNLDYLKEGIGLRGYAQVNPVLEYKKEAFNMFVDLDHNIKVGSLSKMFRVRIAPEVAEAIKAESEESLLDKYKKQQEKSLGSIIMNQGRAAKRETIKNENKVGRNDTCPCGSGKKFKKCCGK
jgi:preprotein translocase subunit SecA